jgi:hypothetical protein
MHEAHGSNHMDAQPTANLTDELAFPHSRFAEHYPRPIEGDQTSLI